MKRFRAGLVSEAHRLVYHSTLGSRFIKQGEEFDSQPQVRQRQTSCQVLSSECVPCQGGGKQVHERECVQSPHAKCCFPCRQSTHPPPTPRLIAPPWPILQTAALFIGTPSSQMTINLYCIFIYYYEFVLHHYKFVLRYYRFVPCYFHFVLRCVVALLIRTASSPRTSPRPRV